MEFKVGDIVVWDPDGCSPIGEIKNSINEVNDKLNLKKDIARTFTVITVATEHSFGEMRITDGEFTASTAPWRWKKVADASVWTDVEPRRLP